MRQRLGVAAEFLDQQLVRPRVRFPGDVPRRVARVVVLESREVVLAAPRRAAAREARRLRRRRRVRRGPRIDEAGEIRMQHRPGAEQAVRKSRRDLDAVEDDVAAATRRHAQRDVGFAAGRDRGRRIGAARRDRFEIAARRAAGIRKRDAEHGIAARERRLGAGGARDERLEIAVAGVHRDDAERGEQEGQRRGRGYCA